ncbi:hypothetical protein [Dolichospermum phage Dfl-JY45]
MRAEPLNRFRAASRLPWHKGVLGTRGRRVSQAVDAVMLACVEALARWRRPSSGAWGLMGPGALRLALGAPGSAPLLDVAVPANAAVDLDEVAGFLHVVAAARVSSRLGSHCDVQRIDAQVPTLQVLAVEEHVKVELRFPALVSEDALQQRQRWPMARLHSEGWPGWSVAALVATPRVLLADVVRRVAESEPGAEADLRWLLARGVTVADVDVAAGLAGRAQAVDAARLREIVLEHGISMDDCETAESAAGTRPERAPQAM